MRKAVLHLKKSDPLLRAIIERVGSCRMEFGEPTFHSLAEAIVYQQLNGKAAVTIFKRFTALAGDPVTPEGILKLSAEQLRAVGLSKQKSSYLFDMAERTKRGDLDFSRLGGMTDDEVIEHLTQVKGVGVWTALQGVENHDRIPIVTSDCSRPVRASSWRDRARCGRAPTP